MKRGAGGAPRLTLRTPSRGRCTAAGRSPDPLGPLKAGPIGGDIDPRTPSILREAPSTRPSPLPVTANNGLTIECSGEGKGISRICPRFQGGVLSKTPLSRKGLPRPCLIPVRHNIHYTMPRTQFILCLLIVFIGDSSKP